MTPSSPVHKAVILARGLGTRMRAKDASSLTPQQAAAADAGSKALLPVGRPFLDYVLSALADGGIQEVCLVVAPDETGLRRRYGAELALQRLSVTFAVQAKPLGAANALAAARGFAGQSHTLVLNCDNYYPSTVIAALSRQATAALAGFDRAALSRLGHIPPERIRSYALLQLDASSVLIDIIEKPSREVFDRMPDALVSMNIWTMPPTIFDACERVTPSTRGELELQDAVRIAIRSGERFQVVPFAEGVLDLSYRADVRTVEATLANVAVQL